MLACIPCHSWYPHFTCRQGDAFITCEDDQVILCLFAYTTMVSQPTILVHCCQALHDACGFNSHVGLHDTPRGLLANACMFVQSSAETDHSARSQSQITAPEHRAKAYSTVLLLTDLRLLCLAGLDGKLQKASKLKGIKNFKASEMGLLPVSVDTWGGFAFIQTGKDRSGPCNSRLEPPRFLFCHML